MSLLKKAFSCTLPNFDVHQIREYRLSWMELTILNNLSYEYRYTPSPYRGIETFNCLLEYRRAVQPDIILQSNTYSITFYEYFYLLYVQKYFKELVDLYECSELSVLTYSIEHLGGVFFYYCQSLGECSQYDHISLLARYSCGIDSIGERPNNPAALMKYLYEDFSIDINY